MTSSSAVHSQAFNFMSFLQNGVDPRTGQYTVSINFPEIKCNELCGPVVPLGLAFNPINVLDSGFGLGWNLNLSQFTPNDSILALSTGETYKVTGSGDKPDIKEKKLDSFHFENNGDGTYRVLHKSGLIEVLETGGSGADKVALPARLYSPAGHMVSLSYAAFRGGQRLETISDAQGELLRINRPSDTSVEILLRPYDGPDGGPLARYELKLTNGWVDEIVLPTDEKASWRFLYEPIRGILCIRDVKTPVGGHETIDYQDQGHPYPGSAQRPNLPRVTRHRTDPGFGQPMMEVLYSYDPLNNGHNFLGNGAVLSWVEGLDNLYTVTHTYEYGTSATLMADGKAVRRVDRTFNRFHLLTEEKTTQDHCVKRGSTTYYAEDKPFEEQVAQFQLPKAVKTSWEMDNDATKYRYEVAQTAYDTSGNLTEQVEPDGIKTVYTYYPREGADGCPPDPEGFVRNLKDSTVVPSPMGNGEAPTLRTRYRYSALAPLAGSQLKDWLVVDSETLLQIENGDEGETEAQLQQILRSCFVEPDNAFLHGRPQSQRVTLPSKITPDNSTITDYQYSKPDSLLAGETVLQTVETLTGFDHVAGTHEVQKVLTLQDSLLHGEPLLNRDDNDVKIRYTYDALTRVTSETVAPGEAEFEATRYYKYTLTSVDGQQAEQVAIDVKGVSTRTRFDGLNRAIYEERQNADSNLRAEDFRQTYASIYDALGNLIKEIDYDWEGEQPVPLTSLFEYDAWGAQRCVTGPDGVKEYEEHDPIGTAESKGPIQRSWRQGSGAEPMISGVTVAWLNLFEKPARSMRFENFDPKATPISLHQYSYDGLGRTSEEIDARDAVTQYSYDAFGRMLTNTLPGGAVVQRCYAAHSTGDLPTRISVDNIVLGEQEFDGLDRMTRSITGGREQTFTYKPGQTQPTTVTTASKQLIHYAYQPQLGEEPRQRKLPDDVTADYVYDGKNARLVSCKEQALELTREYFTTGELKNEQRLQGDESYSMQYSYSRHGRLLSYTDVLGQTQQCHYDLAGRLERTELGTTTSSFTYDNLGQTATIHTQDSASDQSLKITLEYDAFGRETKRTFDLDGTEQQLTQVYNEVDALIQRTLCEGATLLRDETYEYDPRGRLVLYECKGSQPPVDPYGKAITRQVFAFDALDNLTRVITTSTTGSNRATYTYGATDPVQLCKVTNTGDSAYPAEILLDYDADGNLIHDEENRSLEYDALGRLTKVSGLPESQRG
ncbi:RHS repeat domain-containing protein [Pseudomonas sp. Z2-11]